MREEGTEPQPKMKLVYWRIRGGAQSIRDLMEYLNIPYTDVFIDMPKLTDVRSMTLAMHTMPILKDGDFQVVQIVPIAKYICRKVNRLDLLGKTAAHEAKIEEMLIRQLQFKNSLMLEALPREQLVSKDSKKRMDYITSFFEEPSRKNLLLQITHMVDSNGWAVGYLTILDFFFYELAFGMIGFFPELVQSHVPWLVTFKNKFQSIEKIKEYFESGRMIQCVTSEKFSQRWKGDPTHK